MSESQALTEFDMVTVQGHTGLRQSESEAVTSYTVSAAAADLSQCYHGFRRAFCRLPSYLLSSVYASK